MTKYLLLTAIGLLLRLPGLGQGLPVSPPPDAPVSFGARTSFSLRGPGSYQLPDGSWQQAPRLVFNGEELVVKTSKTEEQQLSASEIKRFEIEHDTLFMLNNLPGQPNADQAELVELLFNKRGVRLLLLFASEGNKLVYFLDLPQAPLQLLPSDRIEFKEAILEVVQGCPALTKKISRNILGVDRILEILDEFAECQLVAPPPAPPEPTTSE